MIAVMTVALHTETASLSLHERMLAATTLKLVYAQSNVNLITFWSFLTLTKSRKKKIAFSKAIFCYGV
jgi:hypothetical protein